MYMCIHVFIYMYNKILKILAYIHIYTNYLPTYAQLTSRKHPACPKSRQEVPRFLEQSAVPVVAFLGATFLVAVLSRQFLRVGTWQQRQKERKAAKVRKIQFLGPQGLDGFMVTRVDVELISDPHESTNPRILKRIWV